MKPNLPTNERRFLTHPLEVRAKTDGGISRTIRGYAAVYGKASSNMGDDDCQFFETISPGAFDDVLSGDVVALFNHDPNFILARSTNGEGTLSIGTDDIGLWYEFESPETTCGNDLLESIKRGDIRGSSFSFRVDEEGEDWTKAQVGDGPIIYNRTIKKVSALYDVSPVTNPAYPDASVASVALRSLETFRKASETTPPPPYDSRMCPRQRQMAALVKSAI